MCVYTHTHIHVYIYIYITATSRRSSRLMGRMYRTFCRHGSLFFCFLFSDCTGLSVKLHIFLTSITVSYLFFPLPFIFLTFYLGERFLFFFPPVLPRPRGPFYLYLLEYGTVGATVGKTNNLLLFFRPRGTLSGPWLGWRRNWPVKTMW